MAAVTSPSSRLSCLTSFAVSRCSAAAAATCMQPPYTRGPARHVVSPGVAAPRGSSQTRQPLQQWNHGREGGGGLSQAGQSSPSSAEAVAAAAGLRCDEHCINGDGHRSNGVDESAGRMLCTPNQNAKDVCGETGGESSEEASATAGYQTPSPIASVDAALLFRNLCLFVWLKAIGSYDSGAFSAAIGIEHGISTSWGLSYIQQGTLTSSVFLGNILGCPLAGHLFSRYSEKLVLNLSLVVHTVFTFLFATFPYYYIALGNRFFIGLSLAFIVVYTSVWVDAFAPKDRQSVWMASQNSGVPVGIMMGYVVAALFPDVDIGWEWAFYLKCILMLPTIAYVAKVDTRSINARGRQRSEDTGAGGASRPPSSLVPTDAAAAASEDRVGRSHAAAAAVESAPWTRRLWEVVRARCLSIWSATRPLLANRVYMCSVLTMCSLYFVATGLQNSVTEYLQGPPFNTPIRTLTVSFGVSIVAAPVCGVITGGILLDKFGGYQGNLRRVSLFTLAWGSGAAVFAVLCIFMKTTLSFLLVMSVVLFCGGAIIPPGVGLTMSSLPEHLRSFGAAFSQFMYNTLGNFSGPMVCSSVAQRTQELKYGIMTLLLSSVLGLIPMGVIFLVALRQSKALGGGGGGGGFGGGGGGANVVTIEADDSNGEDVEEMKEHCLKDDDVGEDDGVAGKATEIRPMVPGFGRGLAAPEMRSPLVKFEGGGATGAERMAEESVRGLHQHLRGQNRSNAGGVVEGSEGEDVLPIGQVVSHHSASLGDGKPSLLLPADRAISPSPSSVSLICVSTSAAAVVSIAGSPLSPAEVSEVLQLTAA